MAERRPLVFFAGQLRELPMGDTVAGVPAGIGGVTGPVTGGVSGGGISSPGQTTGPGGFLVLDGGKRFDAMGITSDGGRRV